ADEGQDDEVRVEVLWRGAAEGGPGPPAPCEPVGQLDPHARPGIEGRSDRPAVVLVARRELRLDALADRHLQLGEQRPDVLAHVDVAVRTEEPDRTRLRSATRRRIEDRAGARK